MFTFEPLLASSTAQALGWTLLHSLWQGTLIALLLAGALRIIKQPASAARYGAGVVALALMIVMPVATFAWLSPRLSEAATPVALSSYDVQLVLAAAAEGAGAADLRAPSAALRPLLELMAAAWMLGVVLLSVRLMWGWAQAQQLKVLGTRPVAPRWEAVLSELCAQLRVSRPVRILESTLAEVPMTIGWMRPVILLPTSALIGLSPAQLEAIIAHELAHIRRFDYLVNLGQCVVETLLFYHPAVWWVSRQLRDEREHCCDDVAVAACGDVLTYARALARLESLRPQPQLSMAATGGSLLGRVRRLLNKPVSAGSRHGRWVAGAVAFGAAVTVVAGAHAAFEGDRQDADGLAHLDEDIDLVDDQLASMDDAISLESEGLRLSDLSPNLRTPSGEGCEGQRVSTAPTRVRQVERRSVSAPAAPRAPEAVRPLGRQVSLDVQLGGGEAASLRPAMSWQWTSGSGGQRAERVASVVEPRPEPARATANLPIPPEVAALVEPAGELPVPQVMEPAEAGGAEPSWFGKGGLKVARGDSGQVTIQLGGGEEGLSLRVDPDVDVDVDPVQGFDPSAFGATVVLPDGRQLSFSDMDSLGEALGALLEERAEAFAGNAEALERQAEVLERHAEELERQAERAQEQAERAQEEMERRQEAAEDIQDAMADLSEERADAIEELGRDMERLAEERAEAIQEMNEALQEMAQDIEDPRQLQREVARMQREMERVHRDFDRAARDIQRAQDEVDRRLSERYADLSRSFAEVAGEGSDVPMGGFGYFVVPSVPSVPSAPSIPSIPSIESVPSIPSVPSVPSSERQVIELRGPGSTVRIEIDGENSTVIEVPDGCPELGLAPAAPGAVASLPSTPLKASSHQEVDEARARRDAEIARSAVDDGLDRLRGELDRFEGELRGVIADEVYKVASSELNQADIPWVPGTEARRDAALQRIGKAISQAMSLDIRGTEVKVTSSAAELERWLVASFKAEESMMDATDRLPEEARAFAARLAQGLSEMSIAIDPPEPTLY